MKFMRANLMLPEPRTLLILKIHSRHGEFHRYSRGYYSDDKNRFVSDTDYFYFDRLRNNYMHHDTDDLFVHSWALFEKTQEII